VLIVKKRKSNIAAIVVTAAVFVGFAVFIIVMLGNAAATCSEEALQIVRDSVIRAVVSCYAYEGFYPDNIDYLIDNYSLAIDTSRYLVYFDKIADNLMPNIVISEVTN
jgi:hypothetical protein